jgi:hypothetical protein
VPVASIAAATGLDLGPLEKADTFVRRQQARGVAAAARAAGHEPTSAELARELLMLS